MTCPFDLACNLKIKIQGVGDFFLICLFFVFCFLIKALESFLLIVTKLHPIQYLSQDTPTMFISNIQTLEALDLIRLMRIMNVIIITFSTLIEKLNILVEPIELGHIVLDSLPLRLQPCCCSLGNRYRPLIVPSILYPHPKTSIFCKVVLSG